MMQIQDIKMEKEEWPLCVNCFNCKTKLNKVYCKLGFFKQNKTKSLLFTPTDFDCESYDP